MSARAGFTSNEIVFRHGHMACGIGVCAKGVNKANPRVGPLRGRFECAGGIDVDPGAIRNFERMTGVKGTVMDLFDEQQYREFHGMAPPAGWREATPADIRRVFGRLDLLFATYPCKGFSGLLSAAAADSVKYEALNRLTKRGMHLTLEAYKDDPVAIVAFENVPRIASKRGAKFLAEIDAIYTAYGYVIADVEDCIHDCGELGGLGQSRKRFLRLFRHPAKVPNFIYQPEKKRLRGVGEIIGKLPLPGDPAAGIMHRVPELQWKTWVRLAFVPAGKDWRALNDLAVIDGRLRDFGIMPDQELRNGVLGVMGWDETAGTIVGNQRSPLHGRHSVADPRIESTLEGSGRLGVRAWDETTGTVAGASRPDNGAFSVADPRPGYGGNTHHNILSVTPFDEPSKTVTGAAHVAGSALSVADPRVDGHPKSVQLGVRPWDQPAPCIKGDVSVGGGPYAVSDPRIEGKPRFNNVFRIVPFSEPSPAVAGPGGPAGGLAVADPRSPGSFGGAGKYRVTDMAEPAGTVIGGSTTGQGAFAVADPRPTHGQGAHHNKMKVVAHDAPAPTVTGSDRVGSGALSVADPRPIGLSNPERSSYLTQAHYGVVAWDEATGTVPGHAKYDRGRWSVADPREAEPEPIDALPEPKDRLVARIIARDGTWHRPFTTLELAALQSLFDPEEVFDFDLEGGSDATKREWIGNAVPALAAKAMAEEIGEALLLASLGETFTLSSKAIWVSPVKMALAIDGRQVARDWDAEGWNA
ncbi:DNA cytosine methyltransferase [Sphingomonas sp. OTU376]|uniref:DNA cytosine methyltransferase n=1 Tax=Sphingomonas sp. OTU376 TaxID=3043863 RepID=UPI00313A81AE